MQPVPSAFIQFSAGDGQAARDELFTKHLLKNLTREHTDVRKLFQRISDAVYQESGGQQKPLAIDGLESGKPVYLFEIVEDIPDIPINARWEPNATTVIGGEGSGSMPSRLRESRGIWVQKNNTMLIVDSKGHSIAECSRNGKKRKPVGGPLGSYGHDRLWEPTDIVFDEVSKTFIICDAGNRRVLRWSPRSKKYSEVIANNVACYGVAIDGAGNIYVSDTEKHEVRRYEPGDRYGQVVAGGNGQGSQLQQLNYPTYLCIGPNQTIYISDSDNNRIVRWDKDAQKGVIVAGGRGKGGNLSQFSFPAGVVVDRNETLYVADHWNSRIMRWRRGATRGEVIAGRLLPGESPDQLNGPQGLRFDRDGNLCVVDSYNYRVQRFKIMKPK